MTGEAVRSSTNAPRPLFTPGGTERSDTDGESRGFPMVWWQPVNFFVRISGHPTLHHFLLMQRHLTLHLFSISIPCLIIHDD